MSEEYRLYGFINPFNVWPCFAQPLLIKNETLYFQNQFQGIIMGFEQVKNVPELSKKILNVPQNKEITRTAGDQALFCVAFDKDDLVFGSLDDVIFDYMKNQEKYKVDEEFLQDFKQFIVRFWI